MPQNLMGVVRLTAFPTSIVARILPLDDSELFNPAWLKFGLVVPGYPGTVGIELVTVTRPALPPQNYTRIFLYAAWVNVVAPHDSVEAQATVYVNTTFPDPGNWNPANNKVEVVGAGAIGKTGINEPVVSAGGGGGGGAYAHAENIPIVTYPVPYTVYPGSAAASPGSACVWGAAAGGPPSSGPGVVYAGAAYGGSNTAPGAGGSVVYPAGFGGAGGGNGSTSGSVNAPGGGGGGAAGPAGAGSPGTDAVPTTFGSGGSANAGTNGGGTTASAAGVSGIEWGIAGTGGGGAGSISRTNPAGAGGSFGGGGGGGAMPGISTGGGAGGAGGDGLIVITYVPLPSGMQAQIIG